MPFPVDSSKRQMGMIKKALGTFRKLKVLRITAAGRELFSKDIFPPDLSVFFSSNYDPAVNHVTMFYDVAFLKLFKTEC